MESVYICMTNAHLQYLSEISQSQDILDLVNFVCTAK